MSNLPDAPTLAKLVSNVTQTMCGTSFLPSTDPLSRGESICGTMHLLPLEGPRKISVVIACDSRAGRTLAGALFGCRPEEVTTALADEAVGELLNMIAGQITSALHIDQSLGLPRRTTLAEICKDGAPGMDETVLLHSKGQIDLRLWVFERAGAADAATAPVARSWIRSLLRKS